MKKALSLLLAVLMLASVLTGCGNKSDRGPIIPVYICDQTVNFDPAFAYNDDAAIKILPLIYEGLTKIDSKGKVQNALMDSYTYKQTEDGSYMMEVTLKESYWNDGITVSADDFVYSFKRIMDPEFSSEAAALLYSLSNAREVKKGTMSIDDLGIRSAERTVLQFLFPEDINVDEWLETLASPALVPLRELSVTNLPQQDMATEETTNNAGQTVTSIVTYDVPAYSWSTDPSNLVTNGPFRIKQVSPASRSEQGVLILERNMYYRRSPTSKTPLTKYVAPNQLKIVYPSSGDQSDYQIADGEQEIGVQQLMEYASLSADDKSQAIVFDSDLSLVSDPGKTTTVNTLTQHAYYFNTENEIFDDPQVRRALSMAIDRNAITEIVHNTTASEGWIANGIYKNTDRKTEYRKNYGSLIEASANVSEAEDLLRKAKTTRGKFTLTVRDSAVERAIAEYVKGVWEQLGFTVTIKALGFDNKGIAATPQTKYYSLWRDQLTDAFVSGEFDVIAIDYTAMSTYAYASLAPFATGYTGKAISLKDLTLDKDYNADIPHITGWQNDTYDDLIAQASAEKDENKRNDLLFEAEKILMDEMPVMPIVQYQNAYKKTGALSKIDATYYGTVSFIGAKLKDANKYLATEPSDDAQE